MAEPNTRHNMNMLFANTNNDIPNSIISSGTFHFFGTTKEGPRLTAFASFTSMILLCDGLYTFLNFSLAKMCSDGVAKWFRKRVENSLDLVTTLGFARGDDAIRLSIFFVMLLFSLVVKQTSAQKERVNLTSDPRFPG